MGIIQYIKEIKYNIGFIDGDIDSIIKGEPIKVNWLKHSYKDRWFAGVTPYYVAVVWTGFDIPERINSNGNPAARVWRQVMSKVHSGYSWADFTYPYLAPDTHVFIEAPTQVARTDQDLIEDGITTDDFDNSYYWDNYYNTPGQGGNSVVIIG